MRRGGDKANIIQGVVSFARNDIHGFPEALHGTFGGAKVLTFIKKSIMIIMYYTVFVTYCMTRLPTSTNILYVNGNEGT